VSGQHSLVVGKLRLFIYYEIVIFIPAAQHGISHSLNPSCPSCPYLPWDKMGWSVSHAPTPNVYPIFPSVPPIPRPYSLLGWDGTSHYVPYSTSNPHCPSHPHVLWMDKMSPVGVPCTKLVPEPWVVVWVTRSHWTLLHWTILADRWLFLPRGVAITESVGIIQAPLHIPAFNKGESQLSAV